MITVFGEKAPWWFWVLLPILTAPLWLLPVWGIFCLLRNAPRFLWAVWRFMTRPHQIGESEQKNESAPLLAGLLQAERDGDATATAVSEELWIRARLRVSTQCLAGLMYAVGYGVTQDLVRGYAWLSLAVARGAGAVAVRLRDNLTLYMMADQSKAANELMASLISEQSSDGSASGQVARALMAFEAQNRLATAVDAIATKLEKLYPPFPADRKQIVSFLEPLAQRGIPVPQAWLGLMQNSDALAIETLLVRAYAWQSLSVAHGDTSIALRDGLATLLRPEDDAVDYLKSHTSQKLRQPPPKASA